jgi:hypothetical protein
MIFFFTSVRWPGGYGIEFLLKVEVQCAQFALRK